MEYVPGTYNLPALTFSAHDKTKPVTFKDVNFSVHDNRPYPRNGTGKDYNIATVIGGAMERYTNREIGIPNNQLDALMAKCEIIGQQLTLSGIIVNTGSPPGLVAIAAHGAKENKGYTFGSVPMPSPEKYAENWEKAWINQTVLKGMNPFEYYGVIVYFGNGFNQRNVINAQAATTYTGGKKHGITIALPGKFGTLHELITAMEEGHTIGALLTGGITTSDGILPALRAMGLEYQHIVRETEPAALIEQTIAHHSARLEMLRNGSKQESKTNFSQIIEQIEPLILRT